MKKAFILGIVLLFLIGLINGIGYAKTFEEIKTIDATQDLNYYFLFALLNLIFVPADYYQFLYLIFLY